MHMPLKNNLSALSCPILSYLNLPYPPPYLSGSCGGRGRERRASGQAVLRGASHQPHPRTSVSDQQKARKCALSSTQLPPGAHAPRGSLNKK